MKTFVGVFAVLTVVLFVAITLWAEGVRVKETVGNRLSLIEELSR